MKYRLAIFDLDGTILNTIEDLADSLNFALANNALPLRTIDETRTFVGNGVKKLIERAVPKDSSEDTRTKVYNDFTIHYKLHSADKTSPYKGTEKMLQELKKAGCLLAVVSNKDDYAVQDLCQKYFGNIFDAVYGVLSDADKKPSPNMVNAVLSKLKTERKDAVYIGDSDVDIKTAANSFMKCISVDWGFRDKNFLLENGASVIVSSNEELKNIILMGAKNYGI